MPANTFDFLGEGTLGPQQAPAGRPVSADGLTYTDTGEPTPEYYRRQEALRNSSKIASEGRTATGYVAGGPGGRTFSQTVQGPNNPLDNYGSFGSPGQFLQDAGALTGYAATLGPLRDTINAYGGGPLAAPALLGPIGAAGYVTDRALGGTNTGEGSLFRSDAENAARATRAGAPGGQPPVAQPGQAGTGASTSGVTSEVQRPDSYRSEAPIQRPEYRSDQALGDLRAFFAAQERQGPSEAEALMTRATDRAAGQALGIAAGARGGAGARARARQQALAANTALGAQASSEVAALRAREDADRRNRQAQIMGLISGAAQAGDTRDLGYTQTETERQAALDRLDLGYTQTESQAQQAAASLANTAYQQEADREQRVIDRELNRARYNAERPVGFLDDPLASIFERLFGGPLRSGAAI
jgi:hypothetical protein